VFAPDVPGAGLRHDTQAHVDHTLARGRLWGIKLHARPS
jgi:hypothetical protein